jgi:hypothetical protein
MMGRVETNTVRDRWRNVLWYTFDDREQVLKREPRALLGSRALAGVDIGLQHALPYGLSAVQRLPA